MRSSLGQRFEMQVAHLLVNRAWHYTSDPSKQGAVRCDQRVYAECSG